MTEEPKIHWLNWLATTTVIFSVCSTLATSKAGGFSTKSVITQNRATDQWAYYQAKSIKQHTMELHKEILELVAPHDLAARSAAIERCRNEIERYNREKGEAKASAQKCEKEIEVFQFHSRNFGQAVILLQIAIMLSAIAALLKKRAVWLAGVAVGLFGLVSFAAGFKTFLP